jgi:hypothetical protein
MLNTKCLEHTKTRYCSLGHEALDMSSLYRSYMVNE